MKLYLNPGHGGVDSGASGNGLKEKDLTLKIALKIRDYLKQYEDIEILMSRTTDKYVSLMEATNEANKWGADFFLSIHINAGGGVGYEDFIYEKLSDKSETAKIRSIIHNEIIKMVDFKNRGMKKDNFHVLRETKMNAMLTENGFIDDKGDAQKLKSDNYLNGIALGHANGVAKAFGLKRKGQSRKVNVITGWFEEDSEGLEELQKFLKSKGWYYRIEDAF